jgi:hypothetical protein
MLNEMEKEAKNSVTCLSPVTTRHRSRKKKK